MKAMRYSGRPVNPEMLQKFDEEWKQGFDSASELHKTDMLSLQKSLAELESHLLKKYSVVEDWEFIKTKKMAMEKIKEHGCPIMMAQSSENPEEIVYVLMDQSLV